MIKIVRNFLDDRMIGEMIDTIDSAEGVPDKYLPGALRYRNVLNDAHLKMWPRVESILGVDLIPTYNYSRKYFEGCFLEPHRDVDECEYSLTINLKNTEEPWPIYIEVDGKEHEVTLEPGDALFYEGIKHFHWRMPLASGCVYQTFAHFVDKNGPYKQTIRESLI